MARVGGWVSWCILKVRELYSAWLRVVEMAQGRGGNVLKNKINRKRE